MVQFGSGYGYYMPMDREYESKPKGNATSDIGVGIGDVGMSLGLGPVPNVPAIGAKARAGMKTMELTFMGAGKGSGQGHTPEYYGKLQRQALREMQAANKYDFTTHASVGVYGLAGMDQQGNFSPQHKNMAINEIKRAIEFAADVGRGGPVVVHTGEFARPLSEATWNQEGEFKGKFKMYDKEDEMASFRVVDSRTGNVIQEARKNRNVAKPVWKRKDLQDEAKEMTERARMFWRENQGKGDAFWDKDIWSRFKKAKSEEEIIIRPEEAYIIATLETNAGVSKGWAINYGSNFDRTVEKMRELKNAEEVYKESEKVEGEEKERLMLKAVAHMPGELRTQIMERYEMTNKNPKVLTEVPDIIKSQLVHLKKDLSYSKEASASQWAQAEESMETIRHVESAETYALKQAYDAYAQAGMKAMLESKKLQEQGVLKKPIAVAMENLFPESYGSHPDELKDLVEGSRRKMAEDLVKNNRVSEEEARRLAQQHITATFDTGHLNMWRKYWQGDRGKSMEQNENDFNKWMKSKIEVLAKNNIVGHIHLVDNYGYQDDHLAPGEGNTPIKDIIKIFKDNGYKGEIIVEPGADWSMDNSGFSSVAKTWKLFGSPAYSSGSGGRGKAWGDMQYGYFGQNQPPYFTIQPYFPSEEWGMWSGVPLD